MDASTELKYKKPTVNMWEHRGWSNGCVLSGQWRVKCLNTGSRSMWTSFLNVYNSMGLSPLQSPLAGICWNGLQNESPCPALKQPMTVPPNPKQWYCVDIRTRNVNIWGGWGKKDRKDVLQHKLYYLYKGVSFWLGVISFNKPSYGWAI